MTEPLPLSRRNALRLLLTSGLAVICCDGQRPWAEPATRPSKPFSIEQLRERKASLPEAEYYSQLERWLLELAALQAGDPQPRTTP